MRLTDILKPENIKVPLEATTKNAAIAELVHLLAINGQVTDEKKVLDSVLERESTRTTGIGDGLAIGKPAVPIEFQSIDGRPVSVIWMLTSPPDKTGPHIHALARISRLMTIDKFKQALRAAKTPGEVYDAIVAQEAGL
jgi:mannitol/fructose-specific phosphotransferase system IIA component (Ntr-type)